MSNLDLQIVEDKDVSIVADILSSAVRRKLDYGDQAWGSRDWTDDEIREVMTRGTVYLIKQEYEYVGTVSIQWDDEKMWGTQNSKAAYIHRLATKESFKGQGLGEKAIDWVEEQATKNGCTFLRLDCEEKNKGLCGYYEKLGFIKVGTKSSENSDYVAALYERPIVS